MKNKTKLVQRFEGFDYEAYWKKWEKEHPRNRLGKTSR